MPSWYFSDDEVSRSLLKITFTNSVGGTWYVSNVPMLGLTLSRLLGFHPRSSSPIFLKIFMFYYLFMEMVGAWLHWKDLKDWQNEIYTGSRKYFRSFITIMCWLYKAFWSFIGTVMRHDCYDYIGRIWNKSRFYIEIIRYLYLETYIWWENSIQSI